MGVAMTALFAAHPAYQRAVASKRVGPGVRRAARRLWARPATPDQADPAG